MGSASEQDRHDAGSIQPRAATLLACAISAVVAACGTSEESGGGGDTLEAKGLRVSLERVDTPVPVDPGDVTGLSRPAAGSNLVGARYSWSVAAT